MRSRTFFLSCLWLAGFGVSAIVAEGATREWVAHNSDSGHWSDPSNWRPAGVPQNGDDLLFEVRAEDPFPGQNMINDLMDLRVRKIEFCSDGWLLGGNELTVSQYVGYRPGGTNLCAFRSFRFDCPLKLAGPVTMDIGYGSTLILKEYIDLNGHDLRLNSGSQMIVSGEIRGNGNVIATLDGYGPEASITFNGSIGNTFSGSMTLSQVYSFHIGEVVFDKEFGVVVNDALVIGSMASPYWDPVVCKLARSHQIGDTAEVCVTGGSQFLLDGHTETIGNLCLTNNSSDAEPTLVDTGGSTLSVQGDITAVNDSLLVVPTIKGKLGLPGPAAASRHAKKSDSTTKIPLQRRITK